MKIGFVGLGNMGSALAKGFAAGDKDVDIKYFDPNVKNEDFSKLEELSELCNWAEVLFLAVKPAVCKQVCADLAPLLQSKRHLLVSIVAGVDGEKLESFLSEGRPVGDAFRCYVVAMPNTPVMVAEGVCCYYCADGLGESDVQLVEELLGTVGLVKRVSCEQMDAVPAISGSAPAYVYQLIEAMGQAGVEQGFTAKDAYVLASQTVLGAAKMVLESKEHPAVLRDKVCSPGGSTIQAVLRLQAEGFATAVQKAMRDCTSKIKKMKKD